MININMCKEVKMKQGVIYLGPSTEEESEGYLKLNPHSSLEIHNRTNGIENLSQVKGSCVMIVFDKKLGTNHLLNEGDSLKIFPEGTWHIHANPSNEVSVTHWKFLGDIRDIIDSIRNGGE